MKNRRRRLIQEDVDDPWQMLVACILLNRTTGEVARPVFELVVDRWPSPIALRDADPRALASAIRPVGLQIVKAKRLKRMSEDWLNGVPLEKIHGVGRYAIESWRIFVDGVTTIKPTDRRLREYLERRRHGEHGQTITQRSSDPNTIRWTGSRRRKLGRRS
jgi:methyl-CpG-binding domain protein 4